MSKSHVEMFYKFTKFSLLYYLILLSNYCNFLFICYCQNWQVVSISVSASFTTIHGAIAAHVI